MDRMHADELDLEPDLVHRLVDGTFPGLRDLPVTHQYRRDT
ncbi:MAG: hypothetical protein WD023_11685 [Ilumatobacteraceae bacterium]